MDQNHQLAHAELLSLYNELQDYLDSVILDPEDESILRKCEQLGEKIYAYNAAIVENNSRLLAAEQAGIKELITQTKEAKKALERAEDTVKVIAQIANAIDKVFEQLGKIL